MTSAKSGSLAHDIINELRFEFGKSWQHFLSVPDEDRIIEAEKSVKKMLG